MSLVEIMEFRLKKDVPLAEIKSITGHFKLAMEKIEGIARVDFILAEGDGALLWQIIYWDEGANSKSVLSIYFQLPEMNLFTEIIVSPPKRVNNFMRL